MHSKIASLRVKFKEINERKVSYFVKEFNKHQSNHGYQFGGHNKNSSRRGE